MKPKQPFFSRHYSNVSFLPARYLLLVLLLSAHSARAAIPDDYEPLVVKTPFSISERLIDLTPAFEKAKLLGKPMLVYLGAEDCPPCRSYSLFLEQHKEELKPALAEVVLVDVRTWLTGPKVKFRIADKTYTPAEFRSFVGDSSSFSGFPTWWLLSPEGKQLRQMPQGSAKFMSVENHIKLIKKAE